MQELEVSTLEENIPGPSGKYLFIIVLGNSFNYKQFSSGIVVHDINLLAVIFT